MRTAVKKPNLKNFSQKKNGSRFLNGIDVRYNFDWHNKFGHNRIAFAGYRDLALKILTDCANRPQKPILVLTTDPEYRACAYEEGDDYIVVVNIDEYLSTIDNTANSYFANSIIATADLARFSEFDRLVSTEPAILNAILNKHMSLPAILNWIKSNPDNYAALLLSVEELGNAKTTPSETLVQTLSAIQELDSDIIDALQVLLSHGISKEAKSLLLDSMLRDRTGREAVSAFMGLRVADRILDLRAAIREFDELLSLGTSTESDMQEFIQTHPWLIGLEYACTTPQRHMIQGKCDFQLCRFDGYYDILELKSPEDVLVSIKYPVNRTQKTPPPSAYSFSSDLAQALAQAHIYRDQMARGGDFAKDLDWTPKQVPKLIIVIGQWQKLDNFQQRALSLLNDTLHNAEVIPYDLITQRARDLLDNLEEQLRIQDLDRVGAEQFAVPEIALSTHAKS